MNRGYLIGIIGIAVIFIAIVVAVVVDQHLKNQANKIPDPPSALRIVNKTSREIELGWEDRATNEIGYRIYRNGEVIAERPIDTESYTDYDVQPATEYEYAIAAYNSAGESTKAVIKTKSKNPPITVRLNKIGVKDNGEDEFWNFISPHGEIYLGVLISDGIKLQTRRLPADKFYFLNDDSSRELNTLLFHTTSVGESLEIHILGLEHDFMGKGDDLLIEALNFVAMESLGTIPSLILTVAGEDLKTEITDIGGFNDDFLGEYNQAWPASDNWGVRKEPYHIECDKGNGKIGLQLWFTIESPLIP